MIEMLKIFEIHNRVKRSAQFGNLAERLDVSLQETEVRPRVEPPCLCQRLVGDIDRYDAGRNELRKE